MKTEQTNKVVTFLKLHKQLLLTINVLDADVKFAAKQWRQNTSDQFWSRTSTRCVCASVEGTLNVLKNVTPDTANCFDVHLSEKEIELATERRKYFKAGIVKEIRTFSKFPERVKETFKLFVKAHAIEVSIEYNDAGFNDLCATFDLRNKLMHPRGVFDLQVNSQAMESTIRGQRWFASVLKTVLEKCGEEQPFSKSPKNSAGVFISSKTR
jgi:hypothetical protein